MPTPYRRRSLELAWLTAAEQFPVLLLTGPRQVGQTTALRHLCEHGRRYVSLDDPALRLLAEEDPALFFQRFPPPVLVDEIQYAPNLLPYIKIRVDAAREPGAFWLTGSQHFRMMQGVTETLAGRVAIATLLGFSSRESDGRDLSVRPFLPAPDRLAEREDSAAPDDLAELYRRMWLGGYPALLTGEITDRDLFYSSYVRTYLERDVSDLAQVGNRQTFLRFMRACAARTGQLLNLSELARDVDVSVPTARSWLSILEASFQVHLLRPFHSNVTKRLAKTPKLYFLDTGLCSYLTEWTSPETLSVGAMAGPILETFVVSEILKSWLHRMVEPSLYYYRDRDKREVDLLFSLDGRLHPVEVKRSATVRRDWRRAFTPLERLGPEVGPGGIVCLVRERLPITARVEAIPVTLL